MFSILFINKNGYVIWIKLLVFIKVIVIYGKVFLFWLKVLIMLGII